MTEHLTEPATDRTTEQGPPASGEAPGPPGWRWATKHVLVVALGMIAVQLLFRAWSAYRSGWVGDDLVMMDRVLQPGGSTLPALLHGYGSHMIPGALYLTGLITRIAPYQFALAATLMLLMQALAGLGMLRFLVVAFGARPGILAPLALYLVSPFAIQSTVWWTPGSHHWMLQAALGWGMASQVRYLRTRRWTSAVAAVAWVVVGLAFFEKSLLVIGALSFVTIAYFTTGSARERLVQVWRSYRLSVLLNLVLGLAFIALFVRYALQFAPGGAAKTPIGPMVDTMVLRSWVTGLFGGPLTWTDPSGGPTVAAEPSGWLIAACMVCLVLVVREVARSRSRSLRSLWLPGYFLVCDVLLAVAARASLVGSGIGLEFRYIGELSMASAMCLALATMPVVGAVEQVEVTRRSPLLDEPRRAALACAAVAVLALISSVRYVDSWNVGRQPSSTWLGHLLSDARRLPRGASIIDSPAPTYVALPFSYPANLVSHLVHPLRPDLRFPGVGNEALRTAAPNGHLLPAQITRVRVALPAKNHVCAHRVDQNSGSTVKLDGPAMFGPYWVRIGYLSASETAAQVSAGGASYLAPIDRGLHYLFIRSGKETFDRVHIGALQGPGLFCTDDVTVGQPTAGAVAP